MTLLGAGLTEKQRLTVVLTALAVSLLLPSILSGQATISTGNINGTVIDPTGAAVPGAQITVTQIDTGVTTNLTTNASGFYNSGSIAPGKYSVKVEAKGFETSEQQINVRMANNTAVDFSLKIGRESTTVRVDASTVTVNTETTSVEGVLTATQIESLPVNGRNFLDLAQLEPGVQIQDGTNFDPTKIGYQSVSIGSRFGRTARIQVDGADISDETVGTTTGNISASAIQEFQITQSTMDLSDDLSSSGVVNASTKSGTNAIHGSGYEYYRSSNVDASLPKPAGQPDPNYHRNQYGGTLGGAFVKDKLFYFAEGDATYQSLFTPVVYAEPFQNFGGGFDSPFKNPNFNGRVDYVAPHNLKLFFRYSYSQINADGTFFSDSLQVYRSKNYFRNYVGGADFTTGSWTHSFRFSYLKFQNEVVDTPRLAAVCPYRSSPAMGNTSTFFWSMGRRPVPTSCSRRAHCKAISRSGTHDGLKSALASAARQSPQVFLNVLPDFHAARLEYQHEVINGLKQAWEAKDTSANWERGFQQLLTYFEETVDNDKFWQQTENQYQHWLVTIIADTLHVGTQMTSTRSNRRSSIAHEPSLTSCSNVNLPLPKRMMTQCFKHLTPRRDGSLKLCLATHSAQHALATKPPAVTKTPGRLSGQYSNASYSSVETRILSLVLCAALTYHSYSISTTPGLTNMST